MKTFSKPALLVLALWLAACASKSQFDGDKKSGDKKKEATTAGASGTTPEDENDDNVEVVPPETISGAMLTCGEVDLNGRSASLGYYGCQTFDKNNQRIPVAGKAVEFKLVSLSGQPVDAVQVPVGDEDLDVMWEMDSAVLVQGVAARLTVFDRQGAPVGVVLEEESGDDAAPDDGFGLK